MKLLTNPLNNIITQLLPTNMGFIFNTNLISFTKKEQPSQQTKTEEIAQKKLDLIKVLNELYSKDMINNKAFSSKKIIILDEKNVKIDDIKNIQNQDDLNQILSIITLKIIMKINTAKDDWMTPYSQAMDTVRELQKLNNELPKCLYA